MNSMTGFGRSEIETEIGKVVVEAKSENHRFLDIGLQLPDSISSMEPECSRLIKKYLSRGKVRVSVSVEGAGARVPRINTQAAMRFREALEGLKRELGLSEELRLEHFLMIKDIFLPPEDTLELPPGSLGQLKKAVTQALSNLNKMRRAEGARLKRDLKKRVARLSELVEKIESKRNSFSKEVSEKLKERISRLLEGVQIDEYRLLQEVAFLAERSDITEELVRLRSHIAKFEENFKKKTPVGRELDFLLQEMNREATTMSAKAKDAAISHYVVELKSEMERIKEQVQNIE